MFFSFFFRKTETNFVICVLLLDRKIQMSTLKMNIHKGAAALKNTHPCKAGTVFSFQKSFSTTTEKRADDRRVQDGGRCR